MQISENVDFEKLKREFPYLTELLDTPEAQRDAYILSKINEANAPWGDPPITHLISDEEAIAEFRATIQRRHPYLHRIRRAWAILLGHDQ